MSGGTQMAKKESMREQLSKLIGKLFTKPEQELNLPLVLSKENGVPFAPLLLKGISN